MGALRDLLDRLDSKTDALVGRPGGTATPAHDLTLPGLLGVLALGQRTRPTEPLGLDLALGTMSPERIRAVLDAVAKRLGVPVTPSEAQEVVELLTTGEFLADVQSGLAAAVRFVPRVPVALVQDALALDELPAELVAAVRTDLHDDPSRPVRERLEDLRDGRLDARRRILTNTLRVLLGRAAPGALVGTLRTLIAPENRTFRLAIVVYARLHGVDIDVEDLDALYRALDPADPDLGRLLDRGLDRVREKYTRAEDVVAFLGRLSAAR
jgi:hypothetical protein